MPVATESKQKREPFKRRFIWIKVLGRLEKRAKGLGRPRQQSEAISWCQQSNESSRRQQSNAGSEKEKMPRAE
jgi:hypothetical protein